MIIRGDCIEQMKLLEENSVDAIVTDPPYGLEFMGKHWDKFGKGKNIAGGTTGIDTPFGRSKALPSFYQLSNKKRFGKMGEEGENDLKVKKNFKILPRFYQSDMNTLQKFCFDWASACLRILKPGGFLLAMGGTRTYHRLVCGIEDAGFEIRDTIMWLYGSGFPKSLNIGKQVDKRFKERLEYKEFADYFKVKRKEYGILRKLAEKIVHNCKNIESAIALVNNWELGKMIPTKINWKIIKRELNLDDKFDKLIEEETKRFEEAKREIIGKSKNQIGKYKDSIWAENNKGIYRNDKQLINYDTIPALQEAKEWEGWGTALKPACEPIVVARKPLSEKNVALNVLKWGTGGINIDECRIGSEERTYKGMSKNQPELAGTFRDDNWKPKDIEVSVQGRFPANIILDEEAGKMLDEQSGVSKSTGGRANQTTSDKYGDYANNFEKRDPGFGDRGGASRFFYCAKASKKERNIGCEEIDKGCSHPTVKPIKLMEYLIKLVSKESATILDPFLGSGTTGIACAKLNRKFIGIEKEEEYIKIAEARIKPFTEQTKLEAQNRSNVSSEVKE